MKQQPSHSATAKNQVTPTPLSKADPSAAIVRRLTTTELEEMRRSFAASAAWMDEMIRSGKMDDL